MNTKQKVGLGAVTVGGISLLYLLSRGKAEAAGKATLTITTAPVSGQIFVNGLSAGMSPRILHLDPGEYTISFGDVVGYKTPFGLTIILLAGDEETISGIYTAVATATLTVRTTPVTGEVFIDGASYGPAPITIEVNPGTYVVSFGNVPDYTTPEPANVSLTSGEGQIVTGTYEVAAKGIVTGHITDYFTGLPVAGVYVDIIAGGKVLLYARTNAEGLYFAQVTVGKRDLYIWDTGARYYTAGDVIEFMVYKDQITTVDMVAVSMDWVRAYGVVGSSVDGSPLGGILVQTDSGFSTYTDSSGVFWTDYVPSGNRLFTFSDPRGIYQSKQVTRNVTPANNSVGVISLNPS